jgi:hypothetical protein
MNARGQHRKGTDPQATLVEVREGGFLGLHVPHHPTQHHGQKEA